MASLPHILRREPGGIGLFRAFGSRAFALVWGTDRRRTLTVVGAVCLFLAVFFFRGPASPQYLLQLAVAAAVFGLIILKPHVGVAALVVYRILSSGLGIESVVSGLGVTMVKSLGLFTLVGFLGIIVVKKARPWMGNRTQLFFLYGLVIAILLSSFACLIWASVGRHLFQMFQNLILYVIFVNLYAEAKWMARYLIAAAVAILVTAASGIISIPLSGEVRIAGMMGNPNGLALVSNLGAAIFLVLLLLQPAGRYRLLYVLGLVVCVVSIVLTGSRGGLLTLLVTFTFQLIKRRRAFIPYLVGLVVLVAIFVAIPEKYKERQSEWFGYLLSGEAKAATEGSRGFIYRSAWDMFKRSPIIGIGPRTFAIIYQSEYSFMARGGSASKAMVVHSGFLEVLVENGLVGFIVFSGLIVTTFVLYRRNRQLCQLPSLRAYQLLNELYEAWFLALLVGGAFETIIRTNEFFVGCAAAAAINRAVVAETARAAAPLTAAVTAPAAAS